MKEENLIIHKLFGEACAQSPQNVALQDRRGLAWYKVTYSEIQKYSLNIGSFLISLGFMKGERAALILENRPEWGIIYLGILQAGLVCVPLDPQLKENEIKNLVNDSESSVIFVSSRIFTEKNIKKLGERARKIIILDSEIQEDNLLSFDKVKEFAAKDILWPQIVPQDIASLIYTSGTTAQPKGVLLSHYNLCSNFKSIEKLKLVFSSDNLLAILPLYHTYAFMVTFLLPLLLQAKVTYCSTFKPEELTQIIKEARITILVGVPQLFSMIHKAVFEKIKDTPSFIRPLIMPLVRRKVRQRFGGSLRLLVSGGARLEPQMSRDLGKLGFKLAEGYGLTETSPVVTINPDQNTRLGSVGKPVFGVEVRIIEPNASGVGEVVIRGANVMQGYFKNPELTGEVIRGGWFYSGDLGYLDKEGYLYLTGRKKDVIVLGSGKNIYPEELEAHYAKSPYIKEICVITRSEERFGRMQDFLHAVIVPDLEYFRLKNEKNIRARIRWELEGLSKELPLYKHIMGFTITREELPRTRLKKIKRYEVLQHYAKEKVSVVGAKEAAISEADLKVLGSSTAKKVIDYLTAELKKPVSLDSHLEIDLGIDSLSRVELGLGLQALLSTKIPDEIIDSVSTVRDIILRIQEATEKAPQKIPESSMQKSWAQILKEMPAQSVRAKVKIASGWLDKIVTFAFKQVFLFILRVFWIFRVEGREFIPRQGPYIICPNHASYLDGFFIFSSLPLRSAQENFFLGYAIFFEHPLIKWAAKLARLISIDPNTHLTEAMQAASYVLRNSKVICIFPEGTRAIDENIGEFKKGIGILAKELDVPLLPVYIKGSHYSWPRRKRLPRFYPVKVVFGKPVRWQELGSDYESIARGLRDRIIKLA